MGNITTSTYKAIVRSQPFKFYTEGGDSSSIEKIYYVLELLDCPGCGNMKRGKEVYIEGKGIGKLTGETQSGDGRDIEYEVLTGEIPITGEGWSCTSTTETEFIAQHKLSLLIGSVFVSYDNII